MFFFRCPRLASCVVKNVFTIILLLLLCASTLVFFASCSSETSEQKQHVTVSVYDYRLVDSEFSDFIESAHPNFDIEWIVGKNNLEFYEEQSNEGSLPDVIMVSLFEDSAAQRLSSKLLDVSDELHSDYTDFVHKLPGNQEGVTWVSSSAGYEGILINPYLFEIYGVDIPQTQDEFIAACEAFEAQGVRGFVAGYSNDQTLCKVMQGLTLDGFTSEVAQTWIQSFESGTNSSLDQGVWSAPLNRFCDLLLRGVIHREDLSLTDERVNQMFIDGQAAMIFVDSTSVYSFSQDYGMNVQALPFFTSENTSYLMVEPLFYAAVSDVATEGVEVEESQSPQKDAAITILNTMMSPEGQQAFCQAMGSEIVVSFQDDVTPGLSEEFSLIESTLRDEQFYFPLTIDSIDQSFAGALSEEGAEYEVGALYQAMVQNMSSSDHPEAVVTNFAQGMSNIWSDTSGNRAASSIAQVVALQVEAQVVILSPYTAQCPLYPGEKTLTQLAYPVPVNDLYQVELSGQDLFNLLSSFVSQANSSYDLPVVSGISMDLTEAEEGYTLEKLRVASSSQSPQESAQETEQQEQAISEEHQQTQELSLSETYRVVLSGYSQDSYSIFARDNGYERLPLTLQAAWTNYFTAHQDADLPHSLLYFDIA